MFVVMRFMCPASFYVTNAWTIRGHHKLLCDVPAIVILYGHVFNEGRYKHSTLSTRLLGNIREFFAPFVKNVPGKDNDCWKIAQKFMVAANSPRVCYVEGCWTHKAHYDKHVRGECDCPEYARAASPHAYNLVDGYLVDLNIERW